MRSVYKYSLLSFVLYFGSGFIPIKAQTVKVIKFADLQNIIDSVGDTKLKIINFWATWCKPCIQEIPAFQTISKKYSLNDVRVYYVSMDFENQLSRVERFAKLKGIESEVVLLNEPDYDNWINKVDSSWSGAIPATLMVKTDTKERTFYEQGFDFEELNEIIESLLNK